MHVQALYVDVVGIYDALQERCLVDADAEFGVDVAYGDFFVASCHDVGVYSDADGDFAAVDAAEAVEYGEVIDVYFDAGGDCHAVFVDADAVGGVDYVFGAESGV